MSPSQIDLHWDAQPGLTYHVYRRVTPNNSGFWRLDDPSGSLANAGVAGSAFSDMTSDGFSQYSYIIIAEDPAGNYSAHSAEATVLASGPSCLCPSQSDMDGDGFLTILDVGIQIDVLFAGTPDIQDSQCPTRRSDFDCDGFPTSLDLGGLIDHLFGGAPGPCNPCAR